MNTEQKAQAYDKALEIARQYYEKDSMNAFLDTIFPELAESEDERIRKRLIEYFEGFRMGNAEVKWEGLNVQEVLVWLEKQKEQKPVEWSEEDEKDMAHIIRILDDSYVYGTHDLSKTDHENLVNKLKSLRPSWKPSEEQINALYDILHPADTVNRPALESLYEQLKKLM